MALQVSSNEVSQSNKLLTYYYFFMSNTRSVAKDDIHVIQLKPFKSAVHSFDNMFPYNGEYDIIQVINQYLLSPISLYEFRLLGAPQKILVLTTICSRLQSSCLKAFPIIVSAVPKPYPSAVSKKLIPMLKAFILNYYFIIGDRVHLV